MKTKLHYKQIIAWASLFGFLLGCLFTAIGFEHNAQQEFFTDAEGIDFFYAAKLFLSWFIVGFLTSSIVMIIVKKIHW